MTVVPVSSLERITLPTLLAIEARYGILLRLNLTSLLLLCRFLVLRLERVKSLHLFLVLGDALERDKICPSLDLRTFLLQLEAFDVGRVEFILTDEFIGPL